MVVARLALQPDQRLVVATLGVAAALMLPLAGVLVLTGIEVEPTGSGFLVVREDLGAFEASDLGVPVDRAVAVARVDGRTLAAYVVGPTLVEPGRSVAMPLASTDSFEFRGVTHSPSGPRNTHLDLIPGDAILLHPDDLGPAPTVAAVTTRVPPAAAGQGLLVLPSQGSDAYAAASLESLSSSAFVLILASLPAVALTAAAFAELEARGRARVAATLAALGSPGAGRLVILLRIAWMVSLGAATAAGLALGLYLFAGDAFHPRPLPIWTLLAAGALPSALGLAAGLWRGQKALGAGPELLRSPPTQREAPSRRVPGLPPQAQPLLLGTRLVPLMLLAAALLVVDLGFPLAAAGVPAAIAGGEDELVIGARPGAVLGGQASVQRALALSHDPDVKRLVAEVLVPTAIGGEPVLLRGGQWAQLAAYHELRIKSGQPPSGDQVVLGERLADRLGAAIGDQLLVPAAYRPHGRVVEVSGIYEARGLLGDEGILTLSVAQDLGNLAADLVTVIRAGPESDRLLRALERDDARIEVVDLRLEPESPRAGEPVRVTIDLVNLGRATGHRTLDVRVDGEVMASIAARLTGLATSTVEAFIVAPSGPFQVAVNPTQDVVARQAEVVLQGETIQFDDADIVLHVHDGLGPRANHTVSLHTSLADIDGPPVAQATTDANGTARLPTQPPGAYVAIVRADSIVARQILVGDAAHASEAWLVVESLRVDPAVLRPGEEAALVASVRNVGGVAGTAELPVSINNRQLPPLTVRLQPGQSTVVEAAAIFDAGKSQASLGERTIEVTARTPVAREAQPTDGGIRTSGTLQRAVADEVLGDARTTLAYLGSTAAVASLAIVYLATDRSLRGRLHVLDAFVGLGSGLDDLRKRAAIEGAALGSACFAMVAAAGWLAFQLPPIIGWPVAFGHALPNPITWLVALQGAIAFGAASALAAYAGASRLLAHGDPLRRQAGDSDELQAVPVQHLLEGQP